ncbi:MAG: hypothetical protein RR623_08120 [Bacilli bacterium]
MKKFLLILLVILTCSCNRITSKEYKLVLKDIESIKIREIFEDNIIFENTLSQPASINITNKDVTIENMDNEMKYKVIFTYTKDFLYTLHFPTEIIILNKNDITTKIKYTTTYEYQSDIYDSVLSSQVLINNKEYQFVFDHNRLQIIDLSKNEKAELLQEVYDSLLQSFSLQWNSVKKIHNYFASCNDKLASIIMDRYINSEDFSMLHQFTIPNEYLGILYPFEFDQSGTFKINNSEIQSGYQLDSINKTLSLLSFLDKDSTINKISYESLLQWLVVVEEPDYSCFNNACVSKNPNLRFTSFSKKSNSKILFATFFLNQTHAQESINHILDDYTLPFIKESISLRNGMVQSKDDNAYIYSSFNSEYNGLITEIVNETNDSITFDVVPYSYDSFLNRIIIFEDSYPLLENSIYDYIVSNITQFDHWTITLSKHGESYHEIISLQFHERNQ